MIRTRGAPLPALSIATLLALTSWPVSAVGARMSVPMHQVGRMSSPHTLPAPPITITRSGPGLQAGTPPARFREEAQLRASDGRPGDHLGGPVALSGDTALVGAWNKRRGAGAAYVFVYRHGRWTQQAELGAPHGQPGDWFGNAVALSGDTAVVGASKVGNSGAAYVFVRHGSTWIAQATLIARDHAPADWFGRAVALSGDTILVGAWYHHAATGAVYVFVRHEGTWTQQAELTAPNGQANAYFGTSVALSGDTAVVGAAGVQHNRGAAYVFVRRQDKWLRQAILSAADESCCATFGTAVAMSAGTVLVGAGFAHGNRGAAYVFVRSGTHWIRQGRLLAGDGQAGDWFGRVVALSGDTALVGAWYRHRSTGAAYLFQRQGGRWGEETELIAPDGAPGDGFGSSVALGGGTNLVGAGFKDQSTGAVYVFSPIGADTGPTG